MSAAPYTPIMPMQLALLVALFLSIGCGGESELPLMLRVPSTPVVLPSGQQLVATMTDNELLTSLGLDAPAYQSERTQGIDGFSIEYTNGEQRVRISRSSVSGVHIIADGPKVAGIWGLGGEGT